eukprot:m.201827 g.201827  ORF g.201827 m.201827 type:complete len:51 (-) comp14972_c0_seq1:140-292(-)
MLEKIALLVNRIACDKDQTKQTNTDTNTDRQNNGKKRQDIYTVFKGFSLI